MCGMVLSVDEATEYKENVVRRIEIMENIISLWRKRSLTMNGRIILAKTYILSQIVFPYQFTEICLKELRRIERLIYAFVNGSKSL